jgi:hypothetical protein
MAVDLETCDEAHERAGDVSILPAGARAERPL